MTDTKRARKRDGSRFPAGTALAAAAMAAILLAGCSPRAVLDLSRLDGGAPLAVSFDASLSPASEALTRKLTGSADKALFDGPAIARGLESAGLTAVSVKVSGSALSVSAAARSLEDLLKGAFTADSGAKTLRLRLDRAAVNAAADLLPPSTRDYLDLLMAPALTGEVMDAEEYRDLTAAAYGKTVAGELDAARFGLTVRAPARITAASVTTAGPAGSAGSAGPAGTVASFSADTAAFTIPLITLLTLEEPLSLEVRW